MNKLGPNLYGFLDRPAAQADGFIYSEAMTNWGITWDDKILDDWIRAPAATLPGTTMVFAGVSNQQQRADLIAYLKKVTSAK